MSLNPRDAFNADPNWRCESCGHECYEEDLILPSYEDEDDTATCPICGSDNLSTSGEIEF